jgi:hypothetical protein
MELLNIELIQELLSLHKTPFLSLYMPTHKTHPQNLQDITRFKNLVSELEESLLQKYSAEEIKNFLEPFEVLGNDSDFWNHTSEGLAVLSSPEVFKTLRIPVAVEELAVAADSFHTKPLRQYLQSADHFHILGLSLNEIRLYEGSRHSLVEVELPSGFPENITDAPGDDATRFFREVATYIYEKFSKPSGWPLILAALPEHHSLFQKVSKNPLLVPEGIQINPTAVSADKLVKLAWDILEPVYMSKIKKLTDKYEQAKANGKGSDNIREASVAAVEGKIDTLLIEADRMIAVRITNPVTGNTQKKDLTNPKVDDLLDDMGELVIKMGGNVIVLPSDSMPSESGLAAIYRY